MKMLIVYLATTLLFVWKIGRLRKQARLGPEGLRIMEGQLLPRIRPHDDPYRYAVRDVATFAEQIAAGEL